MILGLVHGVRRIGGSRSWRHLRSGKTGSSVNSIRRRSKLSRVGVIRELIVRELILVPSLNRRRGLSLSLSLKLVLMLKQGKGMRVSGSIRSDELACGDAKRG
jgi:hypothetical protein